MEKNFTMRTAESVTPKHPDKLCDQISDAILDECLKQDPMSRVAIETAGGHGTIFVVGELTTKAEVDFDKIVKKITGEEHHVIFRIDKQSPEIAQGVDNGGAGDQGIMNGYACSGNPSFLPLEAYFSRAIAKYIYMQYPHDGKTQVTIEDTRIVKIVASFQNVSKEQLKERILSFFGYNEGIKIGTDDLLLLNPAGDWNQGGFDADSGLTGRKLAVDNYGPSIPIGGGAFSGKDPTKVDRSAAYMARKIAVDYLHKRGAKEVFVQLAYSIGVAQPVQATVSIDGILEKVKGYDLTPKGIIEYLDLRKPQYLQTAKWGHFGNNFKWDNVT